VTASHRRVACALFACVATCATAARAVTIEVDATAPGSDLEPVWAYYGYDEANYTNTTEGERLLRTLSDLNGNAVYVRTHFLFNTGDGTPALKWGSTNIYTEDASGNPVYDYTLIDAIMDATIASGTLPLFELGFTPEALSTRPFPYQNTNTYVLDGGCFHPPDDYAAWGALVGAWAAHARERYPDSVALWQWELWNEPDIGYWQGTFEEFAELYDVTEAALHAVLPEAPLGGPAVANPGSEFFTRFLEHAATGSNAVSGAMGTRLDFVSFHAKGGVFMVDDHVQMDLGNQLRLHRTGFETIASSAFADRPVVISEADPDGCAACPVSTAPHNAYRNSPAYGAYELAMMKRTLDLASELAIDLRGVLTWAFTFPDSPYFAGYRALSTNGIHLPVLNAFKLLARLDGKRLPVESTGAMPLDTLLETSVRDAPDVDALATLDGERISILVWNYHDDLVPSEAAALILDVAVPEAFAAGGARVTHTRVDENHGDAHAVWQALGAPEAPSASDLAALRGAMEPVELDAGSVAEVVDGRVSLAFDLPRFGISLITLTPSDEGAPRRGAPPEPGCACRTTPTKHAEALCSLLPVVFVGCAVNRRRRRRTATASAARSGP
jgi:xylan 1,4-beta-xylosidase